MVRERRSAFSVGVYRESVGVHGVQMEAGGLNRA